jgi:uncharacterized protein (TIGR03083 family)
MLASRAVSAAPRRSPEQMGNPRAGRHTGRRGDQLDLPTPCAEWTLRQLLGHMIGQHYGFAAAARGETSDLSVWADRPPGPDLHAVYAAAVADVTAAFAEDGMLERRLWLPEIRDGAPEMDRLLAVLGRSPDWPS